MILFHPTLRTNDSRYIKFVDWTTSRLWQWLCIIESAQHERLKDLETRAASESSRALKAKRFFCCCSGCGCLRAKRQFNNLEKMHTGMAELYVWFFFFTPPERFTLPTWDPTRLWKQADSSIIISSFGCVNLLLQYLESLQLQLTIRYVNHVSWIILKKFLSKCAGIILKIVAAG